jgi:hypothetical protein
MVSEVKQSVTMPRSVGGKRDNPTYGQLNANLTRVMLRKIKLYCTALDMTVSEATQEAFALWLETKKLEVREEIEDTD